MRMSRGGQATAAGDALATFACRRTSLTTSSSTRSTYAASNITWYQLNRTTSHPVPRFKHPRVPPEPPPQPPADGEGVVARAVARQGSRLAVPGEALGLD